MTHFPSESNNYLHLEYAKAICLNFRLVTYNNGICNLRLDDINPIKENIEYINSIKKDIK